MKEERIEIPEFREKIIRKIDLIADPPPDLYRVLSKDKWVKVIEAQIKLRIKQIQLDLELQKEQLDLYKGIMEML